MATHQHSCGKNPMKSIKRQEDMTTEGEPPWSEGVQCATGEEQRAISDNSRKNEAAGPKWNDAQLWMYLSVKVKSNAAKNNTA